MRDIQRWTARGRQTDTETEKGTERQRQRDTDKQRGREGLKMDAP